MKIFKKFMRHYWLINWWILFHLVKKHMCLIKGGSLEPSMNSTTIAKCIQLIRDGEISIELPMGAYEHKCCIKYLKKIKQLLKASRNNFEFLTITFDECDGRNVVICPLENCLGKVLNSVGFDIIDETRGDDKYEYLAKSEFWG